MSESDFLFPHILFSTLYFHVGEDAGLPIVLYTLGNVAYPTRHSILSKIKSADAQMQPPIIFISVIGFYFIMATKDSNASDMPSLFLPPAWANLG